jgi:hypothetical protein
MACSLCFSDYIAKCNTELTVFAQLAPLTDYTWIITDKFTNKYEGQFTTNSDGFWSIPVDELPAGLLTQYSGLFTLEVQDSGCKPVTFKIAMEYDCIDFTVKGGTYEKDTIGCDFSCTPAVGSQTGIFPFTSVEDFEIEWTTALRNAFGNNPSAQVYHLIAPDTYQLVDVSVQQVFESGLLQSINVENGGVASGYVLIS